ncbi:MAG: hypothetical protein ACLQU1_22405 [Bryobacteraceae bacterium]
MLNHAFRYLAATALGATLLLVPAQSQTRNHHDFNLNVQNSDAEHCADLKAEAAGEIAQATESFTLSRSQAPVLEISALDRGNIRVLGSAQADYAVEVCKFAVAGDRAAAEQLLRGVTVSRSAGRLSTSGPTTDDGQWIAYFIVHAPKDAPVDLETHNGAIAVRGIDGLVKVHATNGPIAVRDCGGRVEANTINGPIAFEGGGGDIHLQAQNGPIALKLSGDLWYGNQLEAHTNNGPVSLKIPDNFRSGVRVETSGNSPVSCKAAACANASDDRAGNPRVIQMNGSDGTIHISTHNGPIAVGGESKTGRAI